MLIINSVGIRRRWTRICAMREDFSEMLCTSPLFRITNFVWIWPLFRQCKRCCSSRYRVWTGLCRVAQWMFLWHDFHGGVGGSVPPFPLGDDRKLAGNDSVGVPGAPSPPIHHKKKHAGDAMLWIDKVVRKSLRQLYL